MLHLQILLLLDIRRQLYNLPIGQVHLPYTKWLRYQPFFAQIDAMMDGISAFPVPSVFASNWRQQKYAQNYLR